MREGDSQTIANQIHWGHGGIAMARFDLTDFEWSVIEPLLPNKPRGVPRVNDRRVLNGIFWRLRTGAPWADIPSRYGPHTTCVNRFNRWGLVRPEKLFRQRYLILRNSQGCRQPREEASQRIKHMHVGISTLNRIG